MTRKENPESTSPLGEISQADTQKMQLTEELFKRLKATILDPEKTKRAIEQGKEAANNLPVGDPIRNAVLFSEKKRFPALPNTNQATSDTNNSAPLNPSKPIPPSKS